MPNKCSTTFTVQSTSMRWLQHKMERERMPPRNGFAQSCYGCSWVKRSTLLQA